MSVENGRQERCRRATRWFMIDEAVAMNTRVSFLAKNVLLQTTRRLATFLRPTPTNYCVDIVSHHDYENSLCCLLLPKEPRAVAFAVRAFNVEVALVEDQVREYNIGQMRLKFWADALNNIYSGTPPKTPVALELHRVLQKHKLSKHYLKRLIDSRLERLGGAEFPDMPAIERYAEYSVSSIYYLLLEAYGVRTLELDHIASHMGKAQGIVTLLRSIPHNAKNRKNVLPRDHLLRHGVSTESIFQGEVSTSFQDTVFDVTWYAKSHLEKVKTLSKNMDKQLKLVFLPMLAVEIYLSKLQTVDFNVFHPTLNTRNYGFALQLLFHRMFYH